MSKVHGRSSNLWTCVIPVLELIKYVILILKLYLGLILIQMDMVPHVSSILISHLSHGHG